MKAYNGRSIFRIACGIILSTASALAQSRAFVASVDGSTLSVVDISGGRIVRALPLAGGVGAIAISPNPRTLYITNPALNTVSVLDMNARGVIRLIPVPSTPIGVAAAPSGTEVYVSNQDADAVSVIGTISSRVEATIPVGRKPTGIALTPDGKYLYVANAWSDDISIVDTAARSVVTGIKLRGGPTTIVMSPDGRYALIGTRQAGCIFKIATADQKVVATIEVGSGPNEIALTSDGTRAYVSNGAEDTVSVVDTISERVLQIAKVGLGPSGVTMSDDGTKVFVALSGQDAVGVIDTGANTVTTINKIVVKPTTIFAARHVNAAGMASGDTDGAVIQPLLATSALRATSSVTNPSRDAAPDGAAGGALDGTYPNPILRNMLTPGSIPFVSSTSGILDQNPTGLYWDNVNGRLGLGVLDPDAKITIGPNPLNARSLMFRTSEPQYGNYGFLQGSFTNPNGETRRNQTLSWGFNVDRSTGAGMSWGMESYWAPGGTSPGQGQMEHYLAVGGGGPLTSARPISWLYRPFNGNVVMDIAVDTVNLLSLDRSVQYGVMYPGGIIMYSSAVFRGNLIGDTNGNRVQANFGEFSNLKVLGPDSRYYANFVAPNVKGARTITVPDVTGTLALLTGTLNDGDCVQYNQGSLVSAGASCLAGPNVTGSAAVSLGTNSPALNPTSPYTWIQITTADGTKAYIPAWK